MSRAAREALLAGANPSCYETRIAGLQKLLLERGMLDEGEIGAAISLHPPWPGAC